MLALGTKSDVIDVGNGRIEDFINRDDSAGKGRSRLLLGGLVGTGRIDVRTAARLSDRNGLGLGHTSAWTAAIDGAARRRQAGSAVLLAATGLQASRADSLPAAHVFHALAALRLVGLEYQARMIAAELLART
jgi:hypothetical protein